MTARNIGFTAALLLNMLPTAQAETFDSTFATAGRLVFNNSTINYRAVATLPMGNGDIVQVFEIPTASGVCADPVCIGLIRRTTTGTLITSRSKAAALSSVTAATVDSSGRIVVVGATVTGATGKDFGIVRFLGNLNDDTSFAGDGGTAVSYDIRDDYPMAVATDSNDNVVVAGSFSYAANDTDFGVVRVRNNGTLDPAFASGGIFRMSFDLGPTLRLDQANALAIGNDGKIVVGGIALDSAISRLRVAMLRLLPNGQLDTTFCNPACSTNPYPTYNSGRTLYYFGQNTTHSDELYGIETLGNGGFVIVGTTYTDAGSSRRGAIARFSADGSYADEVLADGLGGNAAFRSIRSADATGTRYIAAGDSGPAQNYLLLQAFNFSLDPLAGYGDCLGNSGFCFIFTPGGLGDNGPDEARSLNLDAIGRPLFMADGVPTPGVNRYVMSARFTNSTGPMPDRIFRNGFQ